MSEGRQRTQAAFLAVLDGLMLLLAMQCAWWLRFDANQWLSDQGYWHIATGWTPKYPYLVAVFVTLPLFWLIFREVGLYSEPENGSGEFLRVCAAATVACVLLAAIGSYTRFHQIDTQFQYSRAYCLLFYPLSAGFVTCGRWTFRRLGRMLSRRGFWQNTILFIGDSPLARELAHALNAQGANRVVGTLLPPAAKPEPQGLDSPPPLQILGDYTQLVETVRRKQCDEVVVVLPEAQKEIIKTLVEDCYRAHVRFRMVPDVYDMLLDHMNFTLVGDIPLLGMRGSRIEGINFGFKRVFDILLSAVLLILLLPTVFLCAALAIKLTDGGPIFYFQERIGFRRRHFRFWKFRSMRVGADKAGSVDRHKDYLKKYIAGAAEGAQDARGRTVFKITDDPRVTAVGRYIRQFSIDELPQLWNVLKGDMSLIGPRPPVAYEVENYRPIHLRRFEVLPGISGLWQVSGRNRLTFEEMVKLDLYYIENWSLELDLRILFRTVSVVLFNKAY